MCADLNFLLITRLSYFAHQGFKMSRHFEACQVVSPIDELD